jgi:hypothetical protein
MIIQIHSAVNELSSHQQNAKDSFRLLASLAGQSLATKEPSEQDEGQLDKFESVSRRSSFEVMSP